MQDGETRGTGRLRTMPEFALERFFDRFEFDLPHQLGSSDPETLSTRELLDLADADQRERWDRLRLGYRTAAGDPDLRAAIASLYPGRGPDDVLVAVGAAEALLLAFAATLAPGDRAVALTPAYQSLHEVPRAMGATSPGPGQEWRWLALPVRAADGGAAAGCRAPRAERAAQPDRRGGLGRAAARGGCALRCAGDPRGRGRGLPWARMVRRDRAVRDWALRACGGGRGHVQGVRAGRAPDRLARYRRPRVARARDGDQGLHDAVRGRAVRGAGHDRPARPMRCCASARGACASRTRHDWKRSSRPTRTSSHGSAPRPPPSRWPPSAAPLLERHGGDAEAVLAHWRDRAGVVVAPGPAFGCAPDRFRLGFGRADLPEALEALAVAG